LSILALRNSATLVRVVVMNSFVYGGTVENRHFFHRNTLLYKLTHLILKEVVNASIETGCIY